MKTLGLIFLGVLIGAVGILMLEEGEPLNKKEAKEWAHEGVAKIQDTGDSAAQLKAAEEYYGKAVVLFLAGLVREQQRPEVVLAEPIMKEIKEAPPQETITASERAELASVTSSQRPTKVDAQPVAVSAADKALNNLITHRKSPVATKMSPQVRKMIGVFEGQLRWESGKNKGRVDLVDMDMKFFMEDGKKLSGVISIILTDPEGKQYSRSTGNGENQTLRLVPGRKDQIYVEPAPGDFILLDIRNPNRMSGPYYDQGGNYLGKVEIVRKR
jgi:hypothetical protein